MAQLIKDSFQENNEKQNCIIGIDAFVFSLSGAGNILTLITPNFLEVLNKELNANFHLRIRSLPKKNYAYCLTGNFSEPFDNTHHNNFSGRIQQLKMYLSGKEIQINLNYIEFNINFKSAQNIYRSNNSFSKLAVTFKSANKYFGGLNKLKFTNNSETYYKNVNNYEKLTKDIKHKRVFNGVVFKRETKQNKYLAFKFYDKNIEQNLSCENKLHVFRLELGIYKRSFGKFFEKKEIGDETFDENVKYFFWLIKYFLITPEEITTKNGPRLNTLEKEIVLVISKNIKPSENETFHTRLALSFGQV